MKFLVTIIMTAIVFPIYAAVPGTIICKPYENVWFDSSKQGSDKTEHAREQGKLNGKKLEIIINFKKHTVLNRLDSEEAREILTHAKGNVYYVKGRQKTLYYGAYTFNKDYHSAIYSADGAFATFLQCEPYKVRKPHFIPRG